MCWNKGSPTSPKRTCTTGCYIPGLRIFSALQVNCIWIHVTDIREHVSFAWLPWAEWTQKTKSVSYADEAAVHSVESMEAVIRASEEEVVEEEEEGATWFWQLASSGCCSKRHWPPSLPPSPPFSSCAILTSSHLNCVCQNGWVFKTFSNGAGVIRLSKKLYILHIFLYLRHKTLWKWCKFYWGLLAHMGPQLGLERLQEGLKAQRWPCMAKTAMNGSVVSLKRTMKM